MKRILREVEFVLSILFVAALSLGCPKKETPGPTPEPTPVVQPTPTSQAVCFSPAGPGNPPYCEDADGNVVTCPVDVTGLKPCK